MILLIPLILICALWVWPTVWFRMVRGRIQVEFTVPRQQVRIGESVALSVTIHNLSWLPVPHLEMTLQLPDGLSATANARKGALRYGTFLLMRQSLSVELRCYAVSRGLQWLGQNELLLQLDDGLGLRHLFVSRPVEAALVVLPDHSPLSQQPKQVKELLGNLEVQRWLHPDETLLRGYRPYQSGDPFKQIAWAASARTGSWVTKQFSSSTEVLPILAINAQFQVPHWAGGNTTLFDPLCSVAATVALHFEERRIHCQFASNATNPRQSQRLWYGTQSAQGIRHLLGRYLPYANVDFARVLTHIAAKTPDVAPVVIFSSFLTPEHKRLLVRMARRGRDITVFWGGEAHISLPAGIRVVYFAPVPNKEEVAVGESCEPL